MCILHILLFHTSIHNLSLQPFSYDYNQPSHISYAQCINYIHEWRYLLFEVDTERQNFEKLSITIFPEICWEGSRRKNIFIFSFWCLTWGLNSCLTSNKPTHYLLDYGDFTFISFCANIAQLIIVVRTWDHKFSDKMYFLDPYFSNA